MSLYDLLKDQGSFIGGLFALVAGVTAYVAGRVQARATLEAAKAQVTAVNDQTEAVNRQNVELKRAGKRQLAREGLIAARLLYAVVKRVQESVDHLAKHANTFDTILAKGADLDTRRRTIHKPPIGVIWDQLGLLPPDVIEYYLALDSGIEQYLITSSASGLDVVELQRFTAIAQFLREALEDQSRKAHAVLSETENSEHTPGIPTPTIYPEP